MAKNERSKRYELFNAVDFRKLGRHSNLSRFYIGVPTAQKPLASEARHYPGDQRRNGKDLKDIHRHDKQKHRSQIRKIIPEKRFAYDKKDAGKDSSSPRNRGHPAKEAKGTEAAENSHQKSQKLDSTKMPGRDSQDELESSVLPKPTLRQRLESGKRKESTEYDRNAVFRAKANRGEGDGHFKGINDWRRSILGNEYRESLEKRGKTKRSGGRRNTLEHTHEGTPIKPRLKSAGRGRSTVRTETSGSDMEIPSSNREAGRVWHRRKSVDSTNNAAVNKKCRMRYEETSTGDTSQRSSLESGSPGATDFEKSNTAKKSLATGASTVTDMRASRNIDKTTHQLTTTGATNAPTLGLTEKQSADLKKRSKLLYSGPKESLGDGGPSWALEDPIKKARGGNDESVRKVRGLVTNPCRNTP